MNYYTKVTEFYDPKNDFSQFHTFHAYGSPNLSDTIFGQQSNLVENATCKQPNGRMYTQVEANNFTLGMMRLQQGKKL